MTKMSRNGDYGSYLDRVSHEIKIALSNMSPPPEIPPPLTKTNSKQQRTKKQVSSSMSLVGSGRSTSNSNAVVFRPHVELGTETIQTQLIEDKQKKKLYGGAAQQKARMMMSPAVPSSLPSQTTAPIVVMSKESCLIESTSNSVRISFLFKQQVCANKDPLEASILFQWMRFLQQQADDYKIVRRKPIKGYSITFLVTNLHVEQYSIGDINDMIISFASQVDKECNDIKLKVNAEARHVANELWKAF